MSDTQVIVGANASVLFEAGMTINVGDCAVMRIERVDRNLGVLHLSAVIRPGLWRRFVLWLKGLID